MRGPGALKDSHHLSESLREADSNVRQRLDVQALQVDRLPKRGPLDLRVPQQLGETPHDRLLPVHRERARGYRRAVPREQLVAVGVRRASTDDVNAGAYRNLLADTR